MITFKTLTDSVGIQNDYLSFEEASKQPDAIIILRCVSGSDDWSPIWRQENPCFIDAWAKINGKWEAVDSFRKR